MPLPQKDLKKKIVNRLLKHLDVLVSGTEACLSWVVTFWCDACETGMGFLILKDLGLDMVVKTLITFLIHK